MRKLSVIIFFISMSTMAEDVSRDNALEIAAFDRRFIYDDATSGLAPSEHLPKIKAELSQLTKLWSFTPHEIEQRVLELKTLGVNSLRVKDVPVTCKDDGQNNAMSFKMRYGKPIIGVKYSISIVNNEKLYHIRTAEDEDVTVYDTDVTSIEPMHLNEPMRISKRVVKPTPVPLPDESEIMLEKAVSCYELTGALILARQRLRSIEEVDKDLRERRERFADLRNKSKTELDRARYNFEVAKIDDELQSESHKRNRAEVETETRDTASAWKDAWYGKSRK